MTRKERVYKILQSIPDYTFTNDEDICSVQDILTVLDDYDQALRMMVYQYCSVEYPDREVFDHDYMSAGETAFEVLGVQQGDEVPEDFVW